MKAKFSEIEVHEYLYSRGLEALTEDEPVETEVFPSGTHNDSNGNNSRFLIECKHWVSGKKVTMRWALHLMSVRRNEKADGAILLSSSGFGPRLLDHEVTLAADKLYLRGTRQLFRWIKLWERQYGSIITEPAPPEVLFELT